MLVIGITYWCVYLNMFLFGLLQLLEMLPFDNEISKTGVYIVNFSEIHSYFKIHSLGESCFLISNIGLSAIIIAKGTFGKIQAFSWYDDKYYCFFFLSPSLSPSLPVLVNPCHLYCKIGVSLGCTLLWRLHDKM